MRRAERLFRIVNEMRTLHLVKAETLATQMGVSVRTIYRDIAHLQASGLPIDGEAGVGYLIRPGFDLPNVTFTHDQLDALAVGLAFVESAGDSALANAAKEVRAKIQAGLPKPEERLLADAPFLSLQTEKAEANNATSLRKAIRQNIVVNIQYVDANQGATSRDVEPLIIWDLTDGWMFSGWCRLRQDFRTFRLDRINDLTVTEMTVEPNSAKDLKAFLATENCSSNP